MKPRATASRPTRLRRIMFMILGLVSAGLLPLSVPAARADTIVLRLAHASSESDSQHVAALHFARRVMKRSHDALKIRVHANGSLGNDRSALSGTRGGTIDLVLTGNPYYTGMMPELNVLDLPYLFDSEQQAWRVLDGKVGQRLLDGFERFQLKGLAFWEVGFRSLANDRHPVRNARDLHGLRIRTTPNPAHIQAFRLMGANPFPMPLSEVYSALESGAIDGHENPPIVMLASRMDEVQKHLSLTRHAYTAMPLSMNRKKFDALSAEHQQILLEEARAAAVFQRQYNRQHEAAALEALKAKGMTVVTNPDFGPLRERVRAETRKTYIEKHGEELLRMIEDRP